MHYSCGFKRVYVRQYDGNYLDLVYKPNPFALQQVSFEKHMLSEGAESFPVFGSPRNSIFGNMQGKVTQIVHSLQGNI